MKKFLSLLNVALILFYSVWTDQFLVHANFEVSSFLLNNIDNSTYSFNPGDTFKFNNIATSNNF